MSARKACSGDGADTFVDVETASPANNHAPPVSEVKMRQLPTGQAPLARIESLYMYDESEYYPVKRDDDAKRVLQQQKPAAEKTALKYIAESPSPPLPIDIDRPNNRPSTNSNTPVKQSERSSQVAGSNNNMEVKPLLTRDSQRLSALGLSKKSPPRTKKEEKVNNDLDDAVRSDNATRAKSVLKRDSVTPAMRLRTLHEAAARGSNKVVKAILDSDPALLNKPDPEDASTALLVAVESGNVSTCCLLVERGARLDVKNSDGDGVWDLTRRMQPTDNGLVSTLVGLFKKHHKDYQTTPVHEAAAVGDCDKIEYLVDAGLDQWMEDQAGYSFIHIAAFNNRFNVIRRFMCGTDLHRSSSNSSSNSADKPVAAHCEQRNPQNGKTALHVAANRGHIESVLALLKCGARPGATDNGGWTALHDAVVCRNETDSPGVIRALYVHAPELCAVLTADGETPLHVAARHGRLAAVKTLIEIEQDGRSLVIQDVDGWTPLHSAVESRQPGVVEVIIEAANAAFDAHSLFEMVDKQNRTPLLLARCLPQANDVVTLLEAWVKPVDANNISAVKC